MYSSLPDFQTMKIRDQYTNLQISVLYITDKLVNVDNFVLKDWKVVRKIHQVALLTESCSRTKKLPKTWKVAEKLPSNLWKGLPPPPPPPISLFYLSPPDVCHRAEKSPCARRFITNAVWLSWSALYLCKYLFSFSLFRGAPCRWVPYRKYYPKANVFPLALCCRGYHSLWTPRN